jgi:hypothetical protein
MRERLKLLRDSFSNFGSFHSQRQEGFVRWLNNLQRLRHRVLGKCRKSIFARSKNPYKQLKWWKIGMEPRFGQCITSMFGCVSTSQDPNTVNPENHASVHLCS